MSVVTDLLIRVGPRRGAITTRTGRTRRVVALGLALAALTAGCADGDGRRVVGEAVVIETTAPASDPTAPSTTTSDDDSTTGGDDGQVSTPTRPDVDVWIDSAAASRPIDPRILGTNVPAWLGPERLAAEWLRLRIVDSGVTTLRMPGGSWSNRYDWLGCELGDEARCRWPWAARPSDFVDLLVDLEGVEGMWTVSINHTAESAAALVAFFNGEVDDDTVIGVDRNGEDWQTVGRWAALRAEGGQTEPVGIQLWEVGNEIYGGTPETGGDQCASFGWETVWTCDGTDYVLGDDEHDGFLEIRSAMLAVDPTIAVGAVGVADPRSWANWGTEVIAETGEDLDFYVVHHYGFNRSPEVEEAVARPAAQWPTVIEKARHDLPEDVPVAITEFNLIAFSSGDEEQSMTRVLNALYIADTIGQFATAGVTIANQWNLANGVLDNGTDYGLIDAEDGTPYPQYEAIAMWSRAGEELLMHELNADLVDDMRVYPTRRTDGTIVMLVFNLDGTARNLDLAVGDGVTIDQTIMTAVSTDDPQATEFDRNDPVAATVESDVATVSIAPWSLNLIEVITE